MTVCALIPVKSLATAKQRLASLLTPAERRDLARAMAEDVIGAAQSAAGLDGVAVATSDPEVMQIASRLACPVIFDPPVAGFARAASAAVERLAQVGFDAALVLPADIPLVQAADIEMLLDVHRAGAGYTIVPSHDRMGTNALVQRLPATVPFCFGDNSFDRHLAAARLRGIEPRIHVSSAIALDLDHPDDVVRFLARPSRTAARAVLETIDIAARLRALGRPFTETIG